MVSPSSSVLLKNVLVAGQIALSTLLVTCAGLLVRSLWNLENQPLGMSPDRVVTAQLVLPSNRYTHPAERIAFFNQVEEQIRGVWGVSAFGLSDSLPPGGWERSRPLISIAPAGFQTSEGGTGGLVTWRYVSPGYFDALRISLIEGHRFTESERTGNANLCIVSRSLARRLFPAGRAIGQRLKNGAEIVAIVPDVRNSGLAAVEAPEYYMLRGRGLDDAYLNSTGPVAQRTLSLVIRSAIDATALSELIRRRIAKLDPTLPVEFSTMQAQLRDLAERPRFNAILLVAFACTGLLLAGVGLYGTVAHLAGERTREIGVRMSLGATPGDIAAMMARYVLKWTAVGAAAGVLATLAATRFLSSFLFHVPPKDPVIMITALTFLILVACVAAAGPVRTAARIDPMNALRSDA